MIVDPDALFASAVKPALEARGVEVVELATTGAEAVEAARLLQPDVVLVDVGLKDMGALEVGKRIHGSGCSARLVLLCTHYEPRDVRKAKRLGVYAILTKDCSVSQLLQAIEVGSNGGSRVNGHPMRRGMGGNVKNGLSPKRSLGGRDAALLADQLTEREREILGLLVGGASNETIAGTLRVSPNTVRSHIQNIFAKLGVHSRYEAATFALQHQVVRLV